MKRSLPVSRRGVAIAVVAVLPLLLAVQLLDPFAPTVAEPTGEPPSSDAPAELLRHAIAELDATSYTLTVYVTDAGERKRFWYSTINYTEQELYFELGEADRAARFYFYADGGWVKHPNHDWRHGGLFDRQNQFYGAAKPEPYDARSISPDATRIHNRSEDALWIRVEGNQQNEITSSNQSGETYTLYELDPETYRLRRSIEYAAADGAVRNVYVFEDYGTTTVTRPKGTKNLPINLLSDLLR